MNLPKATSQSAIGSIMGAPPLTRAEISCSRLAHNYTQLRHLATQAPGCDIVAVVKADAYGHGISHCIPVLVAAGAKWLSVTSAEEGVAARALAPSANILVINGLGPHDAAKMIEASLTANVWELRHLTILAETAKRLGMPPGSVPVHLEIDTGMSRQGMNWECSELPALLNRLRTETVLRLDGVFTHFAAPEILDSSQNSEQMERFTEGVDRIAAAGLRPRWLHAGNSSTLLAQHAIKPLAMLAQKLNATLLLRPGIALYGYALPFIGGKVVSPLDLQPVLSWKSTVLSTRTVAAGTKVGYDGTFIAPLEMRLGLLPVGYADGLNRRLSNCGHVLVRETKAPIVGRISMDLTVVDISGIPDAEAGDEVILIGEQNGQCITADDHARWAETISYEILCDIAARVPRIECE
jgi:alanine racemase